MGAVMLEHPMDVAARAISKQICDAMILIDARHSKDIVAARIYELQQVLVMIMELGKKKEFSEIPLVALENKIRERLEQLERS